MKRVYDKRILSETALSKDDFRLYFCLQNQTLEYCKTTIVSIKSSIAYKNKRWIEHIRQKTFHYDRPWLVNHCI